MDADRFDSVARALRGSPSRRAVLSVGVGGLIASLFGFSDTEAKKGRRKKRKKKGGNGSPPAPPPQAPGPECTVSCASDDDGECFCSLSGVCVKEESEPTSACLGCPADTVVCAPDAEFGGVLGCFRRCGA